MGQHRNKLLENMLLTMSPVGVFENEMESFTPGRVMTESSKSSRTSAVSALVMFGVGRATDERSEEVARRER